MKAEKLFCNRNKFQNFKHSLVFENFNKEIIIMRLREIVGDILDQTPQVSDRVIKLDEQVITQEELDKRMQDKSVRITETSPDNYKTLQRLRG